MTELIYINQLSHLNDIISKTSVSIILCDENSYKYCFNKLKINKNIPIIIIKPGEKHKTLHTLQKIITRLAEYNIQRNAVIINLGGGVITDIGGLAASLYKRGINFINIPTTLIGMTDAAHGGKTGANLKNLKNYIGTFSLPQKTIIFPEFLKTLPQKHLISGFAEMLKHGIIADKNYFSSLSEIKKEKNNIYIDKNFETLILKSIEIKNSITNEDFAEQNVRKILNFGHTIGHALESYFIKNHKSHGNYVAVGMVCESYISFKKGLLSKPNFEIIKSVIFKFFPPIKINENEISKIGDFTLKDKKNKNSKINCTLIVDIGKAIYDTEVALDEINDSLFYYINLCRS